MMPSASTRIAFLVKSFPKLSETFILGEVLALEARGWSMTIFALANNNESIRHDIADRVRSPIIRLRQNREPASSVRWTDHAELIRKRPRRFFMTAMRCLLRRDRASWSEFALACTLARQMLSLGIKHVHAHFASQPATVAQLASRMVGGTYSISAHAKDIYTERTDHLATKMAEARFTVTCTKHNADYLREIALPGTQVHVMYHGIDFHRFANNAPISSPVPLILAIGRLRAKKGFTTLIDSCAWLRDHNIEFRCEIIGYGEEQSRLEYHIDRLGLSDHVRLVGAMSHADVLQRYRAATVFAAPCIVADDGDRDGIPNVLLEAMAMSLPVVTTPVSGIPELVTHLENGLLVAPNDCVELAIQFDRLLHDEKLRQRLGQAARQRVIQHFDHQKNLDMVERLLEDVVSVSRGAITAPEQVHA